jgi:DNA helicase-2/ATP-dependent DNA helicase PcrA
LNFDTDNENALWRIAERAWSSRLAAQQWVVHNLAGADGNGAPLIEVPEGFVRAPDLLATKGAQNVYWEVKFRTAPTINRDTGEKEHWMDRAKVYDYARVRDATGYQVFVVLYDASAARGVGQWFEIPVEKLVACGRPEVRRAADLDPVDAWVWPLAEMTPVQGPRVDIPVQEQPMLPDEGPGSPVPIGVLAPIERKVRRRRLADAGDVAPEEASESPGGIEERAAAAMSDELRLGLGTLALETLGLPAVPKYSVLDVGADETRTNNLLGLLDYGIRVFLITDSKTHNLDPADLEAFEDSRLLEWSVVKGASRSAGTVVDGVGFDKLPSKTRKLVDGADDEGGINLLQYEIVHAEADGDVIVKAGAGTGKTETMSERIVFLLATAEKIDSATGLVEPWTLRMDDIVLVTFTREAARQMRERLASTLSLRRRLCRLCIHPVVAWMMDLSSTEISTIHSYAKSIAQRGAGELGLSPGFRVSRQTMQFREELFKVLSPELESLYAKHQGDVPAVHEWRELIEQVWDKLDNNGIEVMPLGGGKPANIDWPTPQKGIESDFSGKIEGVLKDLGKAFARVCLENQAIPTSKLVTTALAVVRSPGGAGIRVPEFVFIDEFQDTDDEQMSLMVGLRRRFGARLFVVGDIKQAIYRFRGAESDSFEALAKKFVEPIKGLPVVARPRVMPLTRNFRSGKNLLDSLHPYFDAWGKADILDYQGASDRLRHNPRRKAPSKAVRFVTTDDSTYGADAVKLVKTWYNGGARSKGGKQGRVKIAVLCRHNSTAEELQKQLVAADVPCELVVGGDFYRSPAVRELRVLLEAVASPRDNAALLELCGTRWATRLMTVGAPEGIDMSTAAAWAKPVGPVRPWHDRFATGAKGTFDTSDLEPLRHRVESLRGLLDKMSVMSFVVECWRHFMPESCVMPGNNEAVEQPRYVRCLEQLLMLMDSEIGDSPTTLYRVLEWLRLQIAVNNNEDEPLPDGLGNIDGGQGGAVATLPPLVTALTVHKSKGLQFDYVLIPHTWKPFSLRQRRINIIISTGPKKLPRLSWEWRPSSVTPRKVFSNDQGFARAWGAETSAVRSEEARLLYVAMTRAKDELVIFRKKPGSAAAKSRADATSWGDLVR